MEITPSTTWTTLNADLVVGGDDLGGTHDPHHDGDPAEHLEEAGPGRR